MKVCGQLHTLAGVSPIAIGWAPELVWMLWRRKEAPWLKVKVKFSLEQAMKAQRGSRGIALLFL
jgi:hypothetical protein